MQLIGPGSDPGDPFGAGDCELLRPDGALAAVDAGLLELAQPVNALSSVAMALVGLWLLLRARRVAAGRWPAAAFGAVTLLAGLGSVDYHGVQTDAAQWTHDGGAAALVVAAVAVPLWRLLRRRPPVPGWSPTRGAALVAAALVAGLAYVGGRSASPLCDPDSVVQLHGLWHLMIGVGAALWAGALWPVPAPVPEPGTWGGHRILRRLVDAVTRLVYRDIDSDDLTDLGDGPVIVVANHFGGLADALVLMAALPRRPRILADDAIWRVPVAGWVMDRIGAVAVHRGSHGRGGTAGADGAGTANRDMFAACADALRAGDLLLVFPEGITRDDPSIGTVHTGTARIAEAAGVDLRIVAVGLHYGDKSAFRSDVAVRRGATIDVAAPVPTAAGGTGVDLAPDPGSVDALTARIATDLRAAAPDYADWDQVAALRCAATVVLESVEPGARVGIGERERLASAYAALPPEQVAAVEGAAERFLATGVPAVEARHRHPLGRLLRLVVWLAALPYAVVALAVFGIPVLLTWAASRLPVAAAVRATVVPIVAVATFAVATGVALVGAHGTNGWDGVGLAASLLPVTFIALVYVTEVAGGALRTAWRRLRHSPRAVDAARSELVAAVERATGVPATRPAATVPAGPGPAPAGAGAAAP